MDEVFGEENFVSQIAFAKTTGLASTYLSSRFDYLLWYGRDSDRTKFRHPYVEKSVESGTADTCSWIRDNVGGFRGLTSEERRTLEIPRNVRLYKPDNITSQGNPLVDFNFHGCSFRFRSKTTLFDLSELERASRIHEPKNSLQYVRYLEDFPLIQVSELWDDTGTGSFTDDKLYVVQTGTKTVQRCILMTTDPGDIVLDPTCGSGITAYVAEQWGRRWIIIDTSRVALALARARVMGARYPYYLLADSEAGLQKEAEFSGRAYVPKATYGNVRHGFVYERVPHDQPHITLKSIANNAEIDVIYDEHQPAVLATLAELNAALRGRGKPFKVTTGGRSGKSVDFSAAPDARFTMPSGEDVSASELVE